MSGQRQSTYAAKGAAYRYSDLYQHWKAVAVKIGASTEDAKELAEKHRAKFMPTFPTYRKAFKRRGQR